ncbi:hypothetical protein M2140_000400 [Clostridiales Family XIII bacterium PM5-7]
MIFKPIPLSTGYSEEMQSIFLDISASLNDMLVEDLKKVIEEAYKIGCMDGIEIMRKLNE